METTNLFTEYFITRLLINSITMIILVRIIYHSIYHKKDFDFTFYLMNLTVFLLAFMLEKTRAFNSLGSAFGLLAAFSLLRFRTRTITSKDMTYLFIIMTIGLMNSIMKGVFWEIASLNGIIVVAVYLADGKLLSRNERTRTIQYDNLENIKPDKQELLKEDLQQRTGLSIHKVEVDRVDFPSNRAAIKIYFY